MATEEDTLGIGELGAFVDTEGSAKHLDVREESHRDADFSEALDALREEKLKDLVFGKQPFQPDQSDGEADEDGEDETLFTGEGQASCKRSSLDRPPAWEDADDARIR